MWKWDLNIILINGKNSKQIENDILQPVASQQNKEVIEEKFSPEFPEKQMVPESPGVQEVEEEMVQSKVSNLEQTDALQKAHTQAQAASY